MWKTKRRVSLIDTGQKMLSNVYDRSLNKLRKNVFKLIFAVAMSAKITPSQLAKSFDEKKSKDFANKFSDELNKKSDKEKEKIRKTLNNKK